ncbi:signal peptide peptidase SppA [Brevundimonas poindexterae]|uniref:signal peptide peptidase SppA n=1 Tax=Brevundimonas poindexterae TaxID=74325 RepID=UPI001CFC4C99|nr:signal peptide peptidase SppA [Brevundimonas poindexterae]
MKQFFLTVLGVFTGLLLFVIVVPMVLITMAAASSSGPDVPHNAVLELDLRDGLSDQPPSSPLAIFGGGGLSVMQVVDTLAQAEDDKNIKVLLVRLPETGMAPAAADEVRQAIRRFRASGKPVIAHSQGFMPAGAVMSSYMVGASASELWMQDTASFQATGFSAEEIFLGRAFDKYGVEPQFEQRYEYKNAVNVYTQSDFTAAHREAMLAWMGSIYDTSIVQAAKDRKLTPAALKASIEEGPWTAEEARERNLVDKVGQVEEAEAEALNRAGKGARIIPFHEYSSAVGPNNGSGRDAIAVIGGEGAIVTGSGGGGSPFGGGSSIYSDVMAEAIYDAIEDKSVKAIVLRVSSPGGSPEASDQIGAAVRAAKAAGKPVVVSMGTYAASGGYWISADASYIVAQPSTLTGSIGVFGGKMVLRDALARFGVDVRGLSVGGEYADAYAIGDEFTPAQREAFSGTMDRIYGDFITLVARGRNLPRERVGEIARGRVWTGAQALELGLVDELGGVTEAIAKARELAGIDPDASVRIKRFPEQQSPFEALASAFGVSGEAARALILIGGAVEDPQAQAVMRRIEADRMRREGAVVLADRPLG